MAWGHTAHRGWARLHLDRARDLIIHGLVHRGANGAEMPTDETIRTATSSLTTSRGRLLRRLGARSLFCYSTDPPPHWEGDKKNVNRGG